MRVLALDQSTKKTGYAVWDSGKLDGFGLIDCDERKSKMDDRFPKMCAKVGALIEECRPDLVVLEEVALQNNAVATLKFLSRLQGFIMCICSKAGIKYLIVAPTTWRRTLGFKQGRVKRDELKQQAFDFVHTQLQIQDVTEDEAEALCIGYSVCLEH